MERAKTLRRCLARAQPKSRRVACARPGPTRRRPPHARASASRVRVGRRQGPLVPDWPRNWRSQVGFGHCGDLFDCFLRWAKRSSLSHARGAFLRRADLADPAYVSNSRASEQPSQHAPRRPLGWSPSASPQKSNTSTTHQQTSHHVRPRHRPAHAELSAFSRGERARDGLRERCAPGELLAR